LALMIYRTHKIIWELDMEHKNASVRQEPAVLSR
jgi:hypothetical protein